ncbi:methyltransferase [Pseudomonas sp. NPDC007930]|uniref:methyltransferase n=1 Tax=Pseudomonas sp. NPDC007930 TaxID=3364417 RepID=UPI0036EB10E0
MNAAGLQGHFEALGRFLSEHQGLWRPAPFTVLACAWERQHPALADWLRQHSVEHADAAQANPYALPAPAPYPALAEHAQALCELPALPSAAVAAPPQGLATGVPGRKWAQIEAFASHLMFAAPTRQWLDWCAGKGYLARRLAAGGAPARCLEWDPALVSAGQALSERHGLAVQHLAQDVLAAGAAEQVPAGSTPVALHACGDLHLRLLALARQAGYPQLAIAPCCYNRTQAEQYQPLSRAGQASGLHLSRQDLALPASEAVTAGRHVRRQRDQSMAFRLAFDLWQRALGGHDRYLNTPSVPVAWLHKPLRQWCLDMAAVKGLAVATEPDWAHLEQQGWARLAQVRNLELLRNLFRRPLELWLVLDRALYLQEAGYQVQVGTFCPPALTPRNVMILAERR